MTTRVSLSKISSNGNISFNNNTISSCTKLSTGVYQLTFTFPFSNIIPIITKHSIGSSYPSNQQYNSININLVDTNWNLSDSDFSLIAYLI
jgi:hypothetical protein